MRRDLLLLNITIVYYDYYDFIYYDFIYYDYYWLFTIIYHYPDEATATALRAELARCAAELAEARESRHHYIIYIYIHIYIYIYIHIYICVYIFIVKTKTTKTS